MQIVHFASFAPNACGLYEAARDMVIADRMQGHISDIVDVGYDLIDGTRSPGEAGKIDNRGGSMVCSLSHSISDSADIIIAHTGIPDNWIVKNQTPIIWIMHGRPGACFRPEQFGKGHSYSLMAELGQWRRIKKMVTFWPTHMKYWEAVIPKDKLAYIPIVPIDNKRFSKEGVTHDYTTMGGDFNVMISDSWREDIDIFEITNGALEFARNTKENVKFHFYGMNEVRNCWSLLIEKFREVGALGEVWGRRPNMEEVYRSADLAMSPQKIVTRSIGEAISCGTPVLADNGCPHVQYNADMANPADISRALNEAIAGLKYNKEAVLNKVKAVCKNVDLETFSVLMTELYKSI